MVLGYHAGYCEVADARAVGGIEVVVLLVEARRTVVAAAELDGVLLGVSK